MSRYNAPPAEPPPHNHAGDGKDNGGERLKRGLSSATNGEEEGEAIVGDDDGGGDAMLMASQNQHQQQQSYFGSVITTLRGHVPTAPSPSSCTDRDRQSSSSSSTSARYVDCPVCLEECLSVRDCCIITPCGHILCTSCATDVAAAHARCPVCSMPYTDKVNHKHHTVPDEHKPDE